MINLRVGDLPSHVLNDLSNLGCYNEQIAVIDLAKGLLIVGHACEDGQLVNLPLIESLVRFAKEKNLHYAIACCYPAKIRVRYPQFANAIIGNWDCRTNLQYDNPVLSLVCETELLNL